MHVMCRLAALGGLVAAAVASLTAQQPSGPVITGQDLLAGLANPTRWLTYSGDYSGRRHSPLTQITPENVRRLPVSSPRSLGLKTWKFVMMTLAAPRSPRCSTGTRSNFW